MIGTETAGVGFVSFLLDLIPIAVIAILVIVFLVSRHRYQTEKRRLTEEIRAFEGDSESGNLKEDEEHL